MEKRRHENGRRTVFFRHSLTPRRSRRHGVGNDRDWQLGSQNATCPDCFGEIESGEPRLGRLQLGRAREL